MERQGLDPQKAIDLLSGGSSLRLSTTNDDGPWKGKDTGKSFGFDLEYADPNMKLGASVSGYTKNTSYNPKKNMVGGTRIDALSIYALGKVGETQVKMHDRVGKIVAWAGAGMDGIGRFGMEGIQTGWHEYGPKDLTGGYNFQNTYEKNGNGNGKNISGFTPTILGRLEGSTPLIGNENKGINLTGSLDGKIALDRSYGETAISATIGVEGNYERLHGYIGTTTSLVRNLPSTSQVINTAINNPKNFVTVGGSIDVYKGRESTTSLFAGVSTTGRKEQTQGTFGIKVSF